MEFNKLLKPTGENIALWAIGAAIVYLYITKALTIEIGGILFAIMAILLMNAVGIKQKIDKREAEEIAKEEIKRMQLIGEMPVGAINVDGDTKPFNDVYHVVCKIITPSVQRYVVLVNMYGVLLGQIRKFDGSSLNKSLIDKREEVVEAKKEDVKGGEVSGNDGNQGVL